jgi:hypothetical protein
VTFKVWGSNIHVRDGAIDKPSITMLLNGGYVVTWRENNNIYFRIVNGLNELGTLNDGDPLRSEPIRVQSNGGGHQDMSDVLVLQDGSFVVTWTEEDGTSTSDTNIYSRKYSSAGEPMGHTIRVEAGSDVDKSEPAMSANGAGWATVYRHGSSVMLIRYHADGRLESSVPIGVDATITPKPSVAYLGGSKHVVAYTTNNQTRFKIVDGATVGGEAVVGSGDYTDIVALKGGNGELNSQFAVLIDDGTKAEVTIYSAIGTGSARGRTITFTTSANDTNTKNAKITALKDGGFAIVYLSTVAKQDGLDLADVFV